MTKFPKIMGVLNITKDSFSDGGRYYNFDDACNRAFQMIEEGADIIDIGGESTRPGAVAVDENEELIRTSEIIKVIKQKYPQTLLSIDTTKYNVAYNSIKNGCDIINDISGLEYDPKIADLAAEANKTLIIMHMQGNPRTMQIQPYYTNICENIYDALKQKINYAVSRGVKNVIADVGIGFGKTAEDNWLLLRNHDYFLKLGFPLLLGISRKSFIGKTFNIDNPIERDLETALIHSILLNRDIHIIRVHNVEILNKLKQIHNLLN